MLTDAKKIGSPYPYYQFLIVLSNKKINLLAAFLRLREESKSKNIILLVVESAQLADIMSITK
jgi:hypothetical protein